jgi:4a-hydroxytetrahydrobiopterin dehydratase
MELVKKHCIPCEGGMPPLTNKEENKLIKEIKGWVLDRKGIHKIKKSFLFKDFKEALKFVNKVGKIAEKEGHHPDIYIFYNKVDITLYTHAVKGLSENDFILAAKIDEMMKAKK